MSRLLIYSSRHIKEQIHNLQENDYLIVDDEYSIKDWSWYMKYKNIDIHINKITIKDFLEGALDKMKFDYIVGNPPYQGSGEDSSNKIFNEISDKCFKLLKEGGEMNFITPTAILTTGQKNKTLDIGKDMNMYLREIDFNINSYFNIDQIVCSWKMVKTPRTGNIKLKYSDNTSGTVKYLSECVDIHNKISQIITNKITWDYSTNSAHIKMPIGQSNQARCPKDMVSTEDGEYNVEVYCNTKNQRIKYCKPEDIRNKNKDERLIIEYAGDWSVEPFISTTEVNMNLFVNTYIMSTNELSSLKSILTSKLFSYAIVYDKERGLKPGAHYKLLFKLASPNLNKYWTDDELYNEFNISSEEITEIENWYNEWNA